MVSRAKNAKDAKIWIKNGEARGLCELSVLGAIIFLKLVLFNNSLISIYTLGLRFSTRSTWGCRSKTIMSEGKGRKRAGRFNGRMASNAHAGLPGRFGL